MTILNLINLLRRQAELYINKLERKISQAKTRADIYEAHSSILREFYEHAFRPTVTEEHIRQFDMETMNEIMESIKTDIDMLYSELDDISTRIQEAYNTNQDYKTSVKNRIQYLASVVSDLNIMSDQSNENFIMFKDSLTNYDFIDKDFSVGTSADISTSEGIAHLHISSDKLVTEDTPEIKISGDGTPGNYHVAKKVNIQTINEQYDIYIKNQSDDDPHDNVLSIVDNQPHTWFEYAKVGIPDEYKVRRYDIDWAVADKMHDELTLKINIKLKNIEEINWISITPYMPEKARSAVNVYSIRVSEDGSEFVPIYKDREIINSEIHLVPQRYLDDTLFNNDTIAKFASQGVFNFPKVRAQYIEIVLKQDKPYDELIANTYYKEINVLNAKETVERIITKQDVPNVVVNGPVGRYQIEPNKIISKNIEVINGWRYCIGIRGIDIYNRKFAKQSELVTKKFTTNKPIRSIVLYTNEIIPDEYMAYGLEKRNDWIKYYISINDIDWYPISPMHHNQVGSLKIPPKIYEINSTASADEKISSINKGYLTSNTDIYSVRLKIVFTRPDDLPESTPILEEYGLKCIF